MICTLLYTFVNIPRQWANALIFSISPKTAVIMFLIELGLHLLYSHFYVRKFSNNIAFPSGTLTAFTNFISVCGPFDKIRTLNLVSNILLATKVIILYPLAYLEAEQHFEAEQQALTTRPDQDPDRIRCWNSCWNKRKVYMTHDCNDGTNATSNVTTLGCRPCREGEKTNDVLFNIVLPSTLGLLVISTLFGYLINISMTKEKLEYFDTKVTDKVKSVIEYVSPKIELLKETSMRCYEFCVKENVSCEIESVNPCKNRQQNIKSDSSKVKTQSYIDSVIENNKGEISMQDKERNYTEHILPDEGLEECSEIISSHTGSSIEIQQSFSEEEDVKQEKNCCSGVMRFFENIRTLFDPDENDNCK